jgi:hypothetical protein
LSSGERLYIHHPNDGINPFILDISASTATPRIGGLFLQQLFLSNGECFGISLIGDKPPDYVSTECVGPLPFLVDIFRAALDAHGSNAWTGLLDAHKDLVWNHHCENARPQFDIPSDHL